MEPSVNSNRYDYRIRKQPNVTRPTQEISKKRYKMSSNSKPNLKINFLNDKHPSKDLALLESYGRLGNNKLPIVDHPKKAIEHMIDEYHTKS